MNQDRLCVQCGGPQVQTRKSVPYTQSGLPNVRLQNVPVWTCANGHEEVEVPNTKGLHELLTHLVIRKPAPLLGAEIRFLRRRVGLSAKDFAKRIGMTPVRLSQLENQSQPIARRTDLLIRLAVAALAAGHSGRPFPSDLAPLLDELEQSWDIGEHRVKHNELATPENEWEEATL